MKNCTEFTFNGISSKNMGVYNVFDKDEISSVIISSAKNLTTARPIYGDFDVITNTENEKLSFSLQLMPVDRPFTPEFINSLYKWFDVDDYAKLSFADDKNFYYMAMPFTAQSEAFFLSKDYGTFNVSFVCDSFHGYIDIGEEILLPPQTNITKTLVKQKDIGKGIKINGNYNIYLYLKIYLDGTGGDSFTIKTAPSSSTFSFASDTSAAREIIIDAQTGTVICDDGSNGYYLCENTDALYIRSDTQDNIIVSNNSSKDLNIFLGGSIPLIANEKTEYSLC